MLRSQVRFLLAPLHVQVTGKVGRPRSRLEDVIGPSPGSACDPHAVGAQPLPRSPRRRAAESESAAAPLTLSPLEGARPGRGSGPTACCCARCTSPAALSRIVTLREERTDPATNRAINQ
jgi:hypothetical protein